MTLGEKREIIRNPFWNMGLHPFLLRMNVPFGTMSIIMLELVYNSHTHLGRVALLSTGTQGPLLIELPAVRMLWGRSHQQWNALVWKWDMFLLFTIHWPKPTVWAQTLETPKCHLANRTSDCHDSSVLFPHQLCVSCPSGVTIIARYREPLTLCVRRSCPHKPV